MNTWPDTCGVCLGTRWWPSRSGYFVCAICTPDPLAALAILARRSGSAAVRRAASWADVGMPDEAGEQSHAAQEVAGGAGGTLAASSSTSLLEASRPIETSRGIH
jgi:hypothetical protein